MAGLVQTESLFSGFAAEAPNRHVVNAHGYNSKDFRVWTLAKEIGGVTPSVATNWDGLEKTDQIARDTLIDRCGIGFGHGGKPCPPTESQADRPTKT